jgi:hypothetical protein
MLNYYEPVINKDFLFMFSIWMNGSFVEPTDYFFLINNSVFSAFSVKYLIFNQEFDNVYNNLTPITLLRKLNYLEYLKKIKYHKVDLTNLETKKISFSYTYDKSIKDYYYTVSLSSDSVINYSFRINPETEVLALAIKVKLTKENLKVRYRKLIFNQSDGLGVELKDKNDNSLCYYFINDYYFSNSDYCYISIPLVLKNRKKEDFDGQVKLSIYPLYSYSRKYEIKQIEILEYPFAFVPSFKNSFENPFKNMKNQNSTNLPENYNNLSVGSNLKKDNLDLVNAYYYLKNIMDKRVYVNDEALPFVFSVNKLKLVQDLNEVKYYFYFLKFNPSNEALISQDFIYSKDFQKNYKNKKYLEYFKLLNVKSEDFIKYILSSTFGKNGSLENNENKGFVIKKIGNGHIELNIKSKQNLFIIINSLYFPGFKAYLMKNKNYKVEIPIIKVNGLVKGVLLPKGEYQFYLVYQPFNGYLIIFNLIYILFILPLILVLSYNSKLLSKFKS